jgi:hypothetical protein
MGAFLQTLSTWSFIVAIVFAIVVVIFCTRKMTSFIKKHPIILEGIKELIASPSGTFSLLTLLAISIVSWKQPAIGGAALAALATVVPAILAVIEHRESVAQAFQSLPIFPPCAQALPPNPAKPPVDPNDVPT